MLWDEDCLIRVFPSPDAAYAFLKEGLRLVDNKLALACFRAAHDEDLI